MRKFTFAIVMASMLAIGTLSAQGAIVQVGYDLNTVAGFETQGANYVQSVIDNGGVLPASPTTITPNSVIEPNAIFWTAVIERVLPGETNPITLDGVKYEQSSDDSGNSFADAGNFVGVDYDGLLRRGFLRGDDGLLWTSDDVEVFDGTTVVDAIIIYGTGYFFGDGRPLPNFPLAITTTVESWGGPANLFDFGINSNSVVVTQVPEPTSLASAMVIGTIIAMRRRRR